MTLESSEVMGQLKLKLTAAHFLWKANKGECLFCETQCKDHHIFRTHSISFHYFQYLHSEMTLVNKLMQQGWKIEPKEEDRDMKSTIEYVLGHKATSYVTYLLANINNNNTNTESMEKLCFKTLVSHPEDPLQLKPHSQNLQVPQLNTVDQSSKVGCQKRKFAEVEKPNLNSNHEIMEEEVRESEKNQKTEDMPSFIPREQIMAMSESKKITPKSLNEQNIFPVVSYFRLEKEYNENLVKHMTLSHEKIMAQNSNTSTINQHETHTSNSDAANLSGNMQIAVDKLLNKPMLTPRKEMFSSDEIELSSSKIASPQFSPLGSTFPRRDTLIPESRLISRRKSILSNPDYSPDEPGEVLANKISMEAYRACPLTPMPNMTLGSVVFNNPTKHKFNYVDSVGEYNYKPNTTDLEIVQFHAWANVIVSEAKRIGKDSCNGLQGEVMEIAESLVEYMKGVNLIEASELQKRIIYWKMDAIRKLMNLQLTDNLPMSITLIRKSTRPRKSRWNSHLPI